MIIQLAKQLRFKEYEFHIEMIGDGNLKEMIQNEIVKYNLEDYITLTGSLPNNQVMKKMQDSNVFLFTSDRNEGWGAVLNEAMSSGCAVVASNEIGSAPFLIENKTNGLIFKSKDNISLFNQVEKLIRDRDYCNELAKNAYLTMYEIWSPENAANNFIHLTKSLLSNSKITIQEGPCSKAYPIKNKE